MNTKNKLIKKLLTTAKKHKVLTYPVMALIAIISAVSNLFSWGKGAGKRVVAIVMVMVMLVSQSYFLTSSAETSVDGPEQDDFQEKLIEEEFANNDNGAATTEEQEVTTEESNWQEVTEDKEPAETEEPQNEADTTDVTETTENTEENTMPTTEAGIYSVQDDDNMMEPFDVTYGDSDQRIAVVNDSGIVEDATRVGDFQVYFLDDNKNATSILYQYSEVPVITGGMINKDASTNTKTYYNLTELCNAALDKLNSEQTYNGCYKYTGFALSSGGAAIDVTKVAPTNSAGSVVLYAKREVQKYKVKITDVNGIDFDEEADNGSYTCETNRKEYWSATDKCYYINPYIDTTGIEISNIAKSGYSVKRATVTNGKATVASTKDKITVTFNAPKSDVSCIQNITLEWGGEAYTVKYADDTSETDTKYYDVKLAYDEDDSRFPSIDKVKEKEGYEILNKWTFKMNGIDKEVDANVSVINYPDVQKYLFDQSKAGTPVTLYPVYKYIEVGLNLEELNFEYSKETEYFIQGKYKGGNTTGNNFIEYRVEGADDLEDGYGIKVEVTEKGVSVKTVTGGATRMTELPLSLKIYIRDKSIENEAEDSGWTDGFDVKINIIPQTVSLQDVVAISKVYDGTTESEIESPLKISVGGTVFYVAFDNSYYNDKNVDRANRIILENAKIVTKSGDENPNYILERDEAGEYSIPGSITPRFVRLETYADWTGSKRNYVRAGESNPTFGVREVKDSSTDSTGFLDGDSIESLGEITFTTKPEREDLTAEGFYEIIAHAEKLANYTILTDVVEDVGSFEVRADDPIEGENYTIQGTKGQNGWYAGKNSPQVVIMGADYDSVRISTTNPDSTLPDYKKKVNVVNLPDGNYLEDSPVIYLQLYDTVTRAVTRWKRIYVKADTVLPEYVGFKIAQANETLYDSTIGQGLYFPLSQKWVTFGNYFNKTVSVTVKFKDVTSGLFTLHYGLYGESANKRTVLFDQTDENGYAEATFEIYKDAVEKVGTVNYYAEDNAGNKSDTKMLMRGKADAEWSVEETGPVVTSFYVKAGANQLETVVDGETKYYSNCQAYLSAKDATSGIYSVAWGINGNLYPEETISGKDANTKQREYNFNKKLEESGTYRLYAVITDNAGNKTTTDPIQFNVDDEVPVIKVTSKYEDMWQTNAKVEFNAYDELSGVNDIEVTDRNGNRITLYETEEDGIYHCYFETSTKGAYTITVTDKAGNSTTKTVNLNKVSDEIPDCPEVTFYPVEPDGSNGWYKKEFPSFKIDNVTQTEDETPVTTKYQLWEDGQTESDAIDVTGNSITRTISEDGIYNLIAWSESMTGVSCAGDHSYQLKVDTTEPEIFYTTSKGSDATILVNFVVTDDGSGVDRKTIKVQHGTTNVATKIDETENGYAGSFEVSETGSYIIQASDIAGNTAEPQLFTPMSMRIKAVDDITISTATLGVNIIKGTYDISSASLSYRKYPNGTYNEVDAFADQDEDGNWALSAVLENLAENTTYSYKVTAVSAGDEVLVYEGYFKTLSSNQDGISVAGVVRYENSLQMRENITVSLYDGAVSVMAVKTRPGEEFNFNDVPDGNYNMVATDGHYSKTMRLLVENGMIKYPIESPIELVLSGKNTSVKITTKDTPNVTADLDAIFKDDTNFTSEDEKLIEAGYIVEFELNATLMRASNVSEDEQRALLTEYNNKIPGAYLDLTLYKVLIDPDGNPAGRERVTQIGYGYDVSVTIPLADLGLTDKTGLEVVRIHGNDDDYVLKSLGDEDNNPNTYTITTNQFSTYAILYSEEPVSTEEPTEAPTEEPTEKPTEGPTEKPTEGPAKNPTTEMPIKNSSTEAPVGNVIKDGTTGPSSSGAIKKTTENGEIEPDEPDADKPDSNKKNDKKKTIEQPTVSRSSVGSLRSSSTAKTGDETPVVVMGIMMLLAAGGIFILRRKMK